MDNFNHSFTNLRPHYQNYFFLNMNFCFLLLAPWYLETCVNCVTNCKTPKSCPNSLNHDKINLDILTLWKWITITIIICDECMTCDIGHPSNLLDLLNMQWRHGDMLQLNYNVWNTTYDLVRCVTWWHVWHGATGWPFVTSSTLPCLHIVMQT